ncbi:DUF4150 domain-containing protein [Beggiatoa alba]|nr:DUF4150 domain-containing protein [Beggiatoa alba]
MAKHNVFISGRNAIHKISDDKAHASAPDVCKTPIGNAIVPTPYPNNSQSFDLKKDSKSVTINDEPAALKESDFSSSTSDQAGSQNSVSGSF